MSHPRSKVVRARAKAAEVRVGKQAITATLKTTARGAKKMESVMVTVAAAPEGAERCYAVQIDTQGVAYLRVADTPKGAQFVVNTGPEIQVVEMDAATQRSRGLVTVPEASVTEAVQILAHPLVKSVIISKRAQQALNNILNDKEFMTMAKEKKAKKQSAKKSTAAAKSGKTAKSNGAGRGPQFGDDAIVKRLKGPSDEQIKRHVTILTALKAGGDKMTIKALGTALGKASGTKQDPVKVLRMHTKALTDGGFISITSA